MYHHVDNLGRVFYVGKGSGRRAWVFSGRSNAWKSHAKKHGIVVKIVIGGLDHDEAYAAEAAEIKKLKVLGVNLKNLCDGGVGSAGWVCDETIRAKMSAASSLSLARPEVRLKLSKSLQTVTGRAVFRVDTGEKFIGATNASESVFGDKSGVSRIVDCCAGRRTSVAGVVFAYVDTGYTVREKKISRPAKPAVMTSTGTVFESGESAAKWLYENGKTKTPTSAKGNISACISGRLPEAYGSGWKFFNAESALRVRTGQGI